MKKLTVITFVLALVLGLAIRQSQAEPDHIRYLGSVTLKIGLIDKIAQVVREKYNIAIDADASGATSVGIEDILEGKADVVGSGGSLPTQAIARGIVSTLIGSDIVAVTINAANPVTSLTREQLKAIFTGKIKNWSEVGGKNARIIVITMDTISAGYSIFKEVILDNQNFDQKAAPMQVPSLVARNVSKVPDAIGFCSLCFIQREANLKTLAVGSQEPSPANQNYPLARPLYWGTKGSPTGATKTLVDFVLSDEGQAILKQSFVGVADTRNHMHTGS